MGHKSDHLWHRDGVYYFHARVRKKRYSQVIGPVPKDEARRIARDWYKEAVAGRLDEILGRVRARDDFDTVGALCDAYRAVVRRLGEPEQSTAQRNVMALGRVLRAVHGDVDTDKLSTVVLSQDLVTRYVLACVPAGLTKADEDRARRSLVSTLLQARSVVTRKLMGEPELKKLNLPDFEPFRKANAGKNPTKFLPLPSYELRRKTVRAAARLHRERSPLYPVYLMASCLGMRSAEIHNARWSWIEKDRGQSVMALRNRPEEDFRVKGARPGSVPVPPAALARLMEYRRADSPYILAPATPTERRNLVEREFAAWMVGLGWDALDTTKRSHELRRLYGSKLWTKYGKEVCHVRMRHSSFSTTERHYLHLNADWRSWELWGI